MALALGATAFAAAQSRRELAANQFQKASAEREDLDAVPGADQTPDAYLKVIASFRRVYQISPHSSKADDSLLAVAEIYALMSQRFGPDPYRHKAKQAYEFLVREYPHSPLSEEARQKLAELEGATAPAPAEPAPAEAAGPSTPQRLPRVTGVRYWSLPGLTRVIVELEAEPHVRSDRLKNPDRVYVDIANTKLGPGLKGKSIAVGDELVKQIRVAQTQLEVTRVVIDLQSSAEYAVSTLTNPPRVVLELKQQPVQGLAAAVRKSEPAPAIAAAPAVLAFKPPEPVFASPPPPPGPLPKAAEPNSRGERNLVRALGLKVARVVIDAGHGGHDTGTIGPTGLMEKDLTLDVALRLGALVAERLGSEVILTRSDDRFVPLEDRTALANEKQADLFISIHANSSRLRQVRGIETYYLNLTADREALEVAARENAAAQKSIHELQDLVSKIALTEKIAESREFAGQVQRALFTVVSRDNPSPRNRGVRKAPFMVLIGARMPSVLAEISFISNPRDEKLLKTPFYRQKIAEALCNGVAGYSRTLSRVEVAAK